MSKSQLVCVCVCCGILAVNPVSFNNASACPTITSHIQGFTETAGMGFNVKGNENGYSTVTVKYFFYGNPQRFFSKTTTVIGGKWTAPQETFTAGPLYFSARAGTNPTCLDYRGGNVL